MHKDNVRWQTHFIPGFQASAMANSIWLPHIHSKIWRMRIYMMHQNGIEYSGAVIYESHDILGIEKVNWCLEKNKQIHWINYQQMDANRLFYCPKSVAQISMPSACFLCNFFAIHLAICMISEFNESEIYVISQISQHDTSLNINLSIKILGWKR